MHTTDEYVFFWGGFLSQWHKCRFQLDGIQFNCAEQAMMYSKAIMFGDESVADAVLSTRNPRKQKSLGRSINAFDETKWGTHKYNLVRRINFAKFDQNENLRAKLFETGQKLIVEASPYDRIWGIGLSAEVAKEMPAEKWLGQNLLGKAITEVRSELLGKYSGEC